MRFQLRFGDPESQQQCRYRTSRSRMRSVVSGATIFKEGENVLESQQSLLRTITIPEVQERSTVIKHLPILKAGSGKCTWRRSNKCTPRMAKSVCREVMANAPTDGSRSRRVKLQPRMRSRLSLRDPDSVPTIPRYTAATGNQLQNQA